MSGPVRVARPLLPLQTLARAKGIEPPAADVTATTAGWVRTVAARNDADRSRYTRYARKTRKNLVVSKCFKDLILFLSPPYFGCFG
jgi:hypothetical protein